MKRPNILNKVYDAMCFRDQELFRKKLIEIGLNSRVFHENYKLDTCKINVMDLYDIMVEIVANHRQYEHPYFVLQDWLKGRNRPRVPNVVVQPTVSTERPRAKRQIELEQIIKEVKNERREKCVDLSNQIAKRIMMGTTLQIFLLKDGRSIRLDPRKEYHYQESNGGYILVPPTEC